MQFRIGQVIRHKLFHYRGVIYGADQEFRGSMEWYETVAKSRPPKDKPWYKVLVHNDKHTTYVAERNLEIEDSGKPVRHPQLLLYFNGFNKGVYSTVSFN